MSTGLGSKPALMIDLQGLSVMTPWRHEGDDARVWVFMPNTSENGMVRHAARLTLVKESVQHGDWQPDHDCLDGSGVWNLEGYVLSVHRPGVKESPDKLLTWAVGAEPSPWQSLHWILDLNRIVPDGRIADNPFEKHGAIAAIKLSDGTLDGAAPSDPRADQLWSIRPAKPAYVQALTDRARYTVDLNGGQAELVLEPVPDGTTTKKRHKRIRLVTAKDVTATVTHLPAEKHSSRMSHAAAAAALMDPKSRDVVAGMTVTPVSGGPFFPGPLCDNFRIRIPVPHPPPPGCLQCPIDLTGVREVTIER